MRSLRRVWAGIVLACAAFAALAGGAEDAVREIVVTFVDRSIDRPALGGPGGYAPQGAQYQATAWSRRITRNLARDYGLQTITEWPVRSLGVHCVVFKVPAGQDVGETIARLVGDKRVGAVQRMHQFRVLAEDPYRRLQGALDALGVNDAHRYATGRDVVVAVVDTGVDVAHPDLLTQVVQHADFAPEHPGEFGDEVHGTAVAGVIAAASSNGQGIVGVAPDAKLLALRACWPREAGDIGALCNSLTLARALDTVLRLRPQVLNLSLAGPADPLLERLIEAALAARIVVVTAEPAAADAESSFPSGIPNVLRVRASAQRGGPLAAGVLEAPATDVLTTFPRGTYNFISGSSFAAAHVSGIVALLLQIRPDLTGVEAGTLLTEAGGNLAGTVRNTVVSACQAVRRLRGEAVCNGATEPTLPMSPAAGAPVPRFEEARRLSATSSL